MLAADSSTDADVVTYVATLTPRGSYAVPAAIPAAFVERDGMIQRMDGHDATVARVEPFLSSELTSHILVNGSAVKIIGETFDGSVKFMQINFGGNICGWVKSHYVAEARKRVGRRVGGSR